MSICKFTFVSSVALFFSPRFPKLLLQFTQFHTLHVMQSQHKILTRTRMHSSMMCTARSLTISRSIRWGGGLPTPLGCRPPSLDADPLPGCRPPLVNRMTDRCKNITFAGGNKCGRTLKARLHIMSSNIVSTLTLTLTDRIGPQRIHSVSQLVSDHF